MTELELELLCLFTKRASPGIQRLFTLLDILLKVRWASTLNTENSQLFGKTDEIQKLFPTYPGAAGRGGGVSLPSGGMRAEERLARCPPAPPEAPLTRGRLRARPRLAGAPHPAPSGTFCGSCPPAGRPAGPVVACGGERLPAPPPPGANKCTNTRVHRACATIALN